MLTGSGKTVAQLVTDGNGNAVFSNLPDGKYKVDITINMKHFVLDADVDSDGNADIEISAQRDASSGGSSLGKNKTLRVVLNDKGKKKLLTLGEWMQASSKATQTEATPPAVALELKIEGSTMKIRAVHALPPDDWKP